MNELEHLKQEIAALQERVMLLEKRADMPVRDGHPLWVPLPDYKVGDFPEFDM